MNINNSCGWWIKVIVTKTMDSKSGDELLIVVMIMGNVNKESGQLW